MGLGPLLPSNGPDRKGEAIQVATLLTVIGEEAREVFSTFSDWAAEVDDAKIGPVIDKFEQYCLPCKNVPFERYCFNLRTQEPGETYDQYRTALMKIAENCDFDTITPREILRDRLVFEIRDAKTRERLLREAGLTLQRTDEICHADESMLVQMKVVGEGSTGASVSAIHSDKDKTKRPESRDMSRGAKVLELWKEIRSPEARALPSLRQNLQQVPQDQSLRCKMPQWRVPVSASCIQLRRTR